MYFKGRGSRSGADLVWRIRASLLKLHETATGSRYLQAKRTRGIGSLRAGGGRGLLVLHRNRRGDRRGVRVIRPTAAVLGGKIDT